MNCRECGAPLKEGACFCPNCGKPVSMQEPVGAAKNEKASAVDQANPPVPPSSAYTPYTAVFAPAPVQTPPPPELPSGKKKRKKAKKQSSGCLMSFLISASVLLVLALGFLYLIGRLLPSPKGNSGDQQVQPEYSEPTETSGLRRELGGNYTPDEKDFRFDDSSAITGYVDHVILVYFKKGVSDGEVRRVVSLVDGELIGCISGLDIFEIRVPLSGSEALKSVCERLSQEESVERATMDSVSRVKTQWSDPGLSEHVPDDPWGEWTWIPQGLRNILLQQWSMCWPRGNNWHQEIIGAPSAWAYEEYYSPIKVGIMDGGFDTSHPDLRITVVNPVSNSITLEDRKLKDSYDHGTHVAGIIGAIRGNGTGVNGVLCGQYTLYGYCLNHLPENVETTSGNLNACNSLLHEGCRVINRSWGFNWRYEDEDGNWHDCINENNKPFDEDTEDKREYTDEDWKDEGKRAARDVLRLLQYYGSDFLLVNAAGNDTIDALYGGWICSVTRECAEEVIREAGPECGYTAQDILDAIIIVGSCDNNTEYGSFTFVRDGNLLIPAECERTITASDFSNFGKQVTVFAPGNEVYSTVDHRGWGSDYDNMPGTSMASPIVAACAAQVWSIDLSMSPGEVKSCLTSTAIGGVRAGSDKDETGCSYSMVDLKDAVESVLLRKGYISETRVDGDLKRIAQTIAYSKLTEGEEEIENLVEQYMDQLNAGNYRAAMGTMIEVVKKGSDYQIYGFFYILAELL